MSRGQTLMLHVANLVVCATGLVYGWMRYLAKPADEWAVVNHPWQPLVQHLHVLSAPLLVFTIGLIWSAHVIGKLKNGRSNRAAGIGLMTLFLPMAASGYLLQVAVDPGWRRAWVWVHVASSLLWVATFVAHEVRALGTSERDISHDENGVFSSRGSRSLDRPASCPQKTAARSARVSEDRMER